MSFGQDQTPINVRAILRNEDDILLLGPRNGNTTDRFDFPGGLVNAYEARLPPDQAWPTALRRCILLQTGITEAEISQQYITGTWPAKIGSQVVQATGIFFPCWTTQRRTYAQSKQSHGSWVPLANIATYPMVGQSDKVLGRYLQLNAAGKLW